MNNKILAADDTKSWQTFHKVLIEQLWGNLFEVDTASSAKEALHLINLNKRNPYTLIITDLQMENNYLPLSAGEYLIENIKLIKEYYASNIIIVSSMYNIEETAKKYNVNCISKSRLAANRLLMKYMFEKLMPSLDAVYRIKKGGSL